MAEEKRVPLHMKLSAVQEDVDSIISYLKKQKLKIQQLEQDVKALKSGTLGQSSNDVYTTIMHDEFFSKAAISVNSEGELSLSEQPPPLPKTYAELMAFLNVKRVPYMWDEKQFHYLEFSGEHEGGFSEIMQSASYTFAEKVEQFLRLPAKIRRNPDRLPKKHTMFKDKIQLLCGRLRCLLSYSYDIAKMTKTRTRVNENRTPAAQRKLGIQNMINSQTPFMAHLLQCAVEEAQLLNRNLFSEDEAETAFYKVVKPMKDTDNYNAKNCLLVDFHDDDVMKLASMSAKLKTNNKSAKAKKRGKQSQRNDEPKQKKQKYSPLLAHNETLKDNEVDMEQTAVAIELTNENKGHKMEKPLQKKSNMQDEKTGKAEKKQKRKRDKRKSGQDEKWQTSQEHQSHQPSFEESLQKSAESQKRKRHDKKNKKHLSAKTSPELSNRQFDDSGDETACSGKKSGHLKWKEAPAVKAICENKIEKTPDKQATKNSDSDDDEELIKAIAEA